MRSPICLLAGDSDLTAAAVRAGTEFPCAHRLGVRVEHMITPPYVSSVIPCIKYAGWCDNDFNVCTYSCKRRLAERAVWSSHWTIVHAMTARAARRQVLRGLYGRLRRLAGLGGGP